MSGRKDRTIAELILVPKPANRKYGIAQGKEADISSKQCTSQPKYAGAALGFAAGPAVLSPGYNFVVASG